MYTYEMEVFAEQRMADRLREAEHERLVRELRGGSPRRGWSMAVLRRFGGTLRTALLAAAPHAQPRIPLARTRD
jgi:hypothetical protein